MFNENYSLHYLRLSFCCCAPWFVVSFYYSDLKKLVFRFAKKVFFIQSFIVSM